MSRKQQILFFVLGAASVVLAIVCYRVGAWLIDSIGMAPVSMIGIEKYPDKLVYVIGKDTELDFSGGAVWMGITERAPSTYEMSEKNIGYEFDVVTDADLSKEGVYVVTLTRGDEMQCSFPIQVIAPDYVE